MTGGNDVTILLRADASATIGLGHATRLASLGIALSERGARPIFVSAAPPAGMQELAKRAGLPLVEGQDSDLPRLAADTRAQVVVIDSYETVAPTLHDLEARGIRTAYVDDNGLAPASAASLVVNTNVFGADIHYRTKPEAVVLVGPRYALLRPEFVRARAANEPPHGDAHVLLTFGGSDPMRLTDSWLAACGTMETSPPLEIIVGPAHAAPHRVRAAARALPRATVISSPSDMANRIAAASVIVTAAGSTCLEIACIGRPAIAMVAAENQRAVANALEASGLMRVVDAATPPPGLGKALQTLVADAAACSEMARTQRNLVDGLGASRVAEAVVTLAAKDP
jgi:spore coat polysaccharide biosynthesis predicted glycosyltransferase SpsG